VENPLETKGLPEIEQLESDANVGKKYRILVAEDSAECVVPISLYLQQCGYEVVTAIDGEEALKVTALTGPDLILMDISMPVLDGLGAIRRLREQCAPAYIPIIAISAFSTSGFLQAAHDAGFDGYLTKPFDFNRMDALIKTLLPVR